MTTVAKTELFRRGEVATILGVSISTVDKLIKAGRIRGCYPSKGSLRISKSALDEFLAEIDGGKTNAA